MRIVLGNDKLKVEDATEEALDLIDSLLTIRTTKFIFAKSCKPRYDGTKSESLFDPDTKSCAAGFYPRLLGACRKSGYETTLVDTRVRPCEPDAGADLAWLRDYQRAALDISLLRTRGILHMGTGSGKCLGIGTGVLMFNGSIKKVEDVVTGDLLMGPDSAPRAVTSTTRGTGPLYRITPKAGEPWVCNDVHVLTLKHTETGAIIDIPLNEYLQKSKNFKHLHKQFSVGVDFQVPENALPHKVSPYFMGVWLGDGSKGKFPAVRVTKPDPEIAVAMHEEAARFGMSVRTDVRASDGGITHRVVKHSRHWVDGSRENKLKTALLACVDFENFVVPREYLCGTRHDRLELLAGLLDTDGHLDHKGMGFDFVQKRRGIADAAVFLARSLGLRATMSEKTVPGYGLYWRVYIGGEVSIIPTRIPRKQAASKRQTDSLRTGFFVEPIGPGEYAGFTLTGDGRFLLENFTVTHNTDVAVGLFRALPGAKWLVLVHKANLVRDIKARAELRAREHGHASPDIGVYGDGSHDTGNQIIVATFQSIALGMNSPVVKALLKSVTAVLVDECHTSSASNFSRVIRKCVNAYWRYGCSGTPLDRTDKRSLVTIGLLGPVIYQLKADVLIEAGVLAKATVNIVQYDDEPFESDLWATVKKRGIQESVKRNEAVVWATVQAPKPALLFVDTIDHGKGLTKGLQRAGLNAEFVWGSSDTNQRAAAGKRLVRGDIDVLVTSPVFDEGADFPSLESVVLAGGGRSVIKLLQRIGRGMRKADGKDSFSVYDFNDQSHKILAKHAAERRRVLKAEGHALVKIKAPVKL